MAERDRPHIVVRTLPASEPFTLAGAGPHPGQRPSTHLPSAEPSMTPTPSSPTWIVTNLADPDYSSSLPETSEISEPPMTTAPAATWNPSKTPLKRGTHLQSVRTRHTTTWLVHQRDSRATH